MISEQKIEQWRKTMLGYMVCYLVGTVFLSPILIDLLDTYFMYSQAIGYAAYLIGSIPTGYLIAQLYGVRDIRTHGSGNSGATNVARTLGSHFFPLVLLLDAGKAYAYLWFLSYAGLTVPGILWCSVILLIGNGFSIFLSGSGGKGVATSIGIVAALQPWVAVWFAVIWALGVALLKNVGIASVLSVFLVPFVAMYYGASVSLLGIYFFITCWVTWRHHENIRRFWYRTS